jgi:hypothetical protein
MAMHAGIQVLHPALNYCPALISRIRPSINGQTMANSAPRRFSSSSLLFLIKTAPDSVVTGLGIITEDRNSSPR